MCGIAGQIALNGSKIQEIAALGGYNRMREALRRRGPDQDGIYVDENGKAALIHTRLAVIDIENGRQPMRFRARGEVFTLVYNGELYNTDELRRELVALGHTFRTRSDTEVVGEAYIEWGSAALDRLNGIFAFAIWEQNAEKLFLARDRIGVKPLFFALCGGGIIFASELPALLAHPDITPELDAEGISELLFIAPGRTPGCGVLREIEELKPAHFAEFDSRGLQTHRYWRLTDREYGGNFDDAVEQTRFLVRDAIERQLVSDVPVATFLSGGLDSSIISAIAHEHMKSRGEALKTFSVGYRDNTKFFKAGKFQPNSDEAFIAKMNEHLQSAEHYDITLDTAELIPALYEATEARGLPGMGDVDASLLLFCREIKRHATVALSGECADEIFGGYPWYRDETIREIDGFPWAQSTSLRQSLLHPDFKIDGASYIRERYEQTLADSSTAPANAGERRIKEMVNLNFDWFMQTLLDRKDRMSMYSGLEVRVPFCDYRIAEFVYTLPWSFKDYNNTEKGLLRTAMQGLLPDEVLWRKKSPYPKTHNPSYMQAVTSELQEVLADSTSPLLQIVRLEALIELTQGGSDTPFYGQLMTAPQTIAYFLQLNYWLAKYKVRIL